MDLEEALDRMDADETDALKKRARAFVLRFLAEAVAVGDESVPLWGHAHAFASASWHTEPPGFAPTEEQVALCLDEFQLLVHHAACHRIFFAFTDLDVWAAAMLAVGYLRRGIRGGRAVPSRPVLLKLLQFGISEWPTVVTQDNVRTRLFDDAYGTLRSIAEHLAAPAASGGVPGSHRDEMAE